MKNCLMNGFFFFYGIYPIYSLFNTASDAAASLVVLGASFIVLDTSLVIVIKIVADKVAAKITVRASIVIYTLIMAK